MPFSYNYVIEKDKFDNRLLSELQHRIRVPLKCYTVTEFKLKEDNSFEFKKTNRKMFGGNKITINDKNLHHGSYLKEELSETLYRITLTFYD
jgi:hypothetical protein